MRDADSPVSIFEILSGHLNQQESRIATVVLICDYYSLEDCKYEIAYLLENIFYLWYLSIVVQKKIS